MNDREAPPILPLSRLRETSKAAAPGRFRSGVNRFGNTCRNFPRRPFPAQIGFLNGTAPKPQTLHPIQERSVSKPLAQKIRTIAIAAALPALLAGCGADKVDTASEAEMLMATSREWSRVSSTQDVDAILRYFAEDAVIMLPGQPTVRGKAAIRDYLERTSKIPGFKIRWEPLEAKISLSGDMGYLIERTQVTMNGPDGQPVTERLKALSVWRKQPDGSWKAAIDISNPDPAS
jgi:uncharacterized protein (TIGR02246 family)